MLQVGSIGQKATFRTHLALELFRKSQIVNRESNNQLRPQQRLIDD